MTDHFSRHLKISAAFHICLGLFIFFRAIMMPHQPIEIRSAIHVDLVGLPEKMPEGPPPDLTVEPSASDKPAPVAPAEPTPAPKKAATPAQQPTETKPTLPKKNFAKNQRNALNRLKASQALENIKAEVAESKKSARRPVYGNEVSSGDALTGIPRLEYQRYLREVKKAISSHWSLPQWLKDAPLKAQAQILIDSRGYIVKRILVHSSGNEVFDAQVMQTLESSSPLPEPPKDLQDLLSTSGIGLNFPD